MIEVRRLKEDELNVYLEKYTILGERTSGFMIEHPRAVRTMPHKVNSEVVEANIRPKMVRDLIKEIVTLRSNYVKNCYETSRNDGVRWRHIELIDSVGRITRLSFAYRLNKVDVSYRSLDGSKIRYYEMFCFTPEALIESVNYIWQVNQNAPGFLSREFDIKYQGKVNGETKYVFVI